MLNFVKLLLNWAFFFMIVANAVFATEPSGVPILRIETGMHTDGIAQISVDAQERFLLTASEDKTLRLWDLKTGDLIRTYRVPIGTGSEGLLYAGVISPDGELVAGGGWTGFEWEQNNSIYLFNRITGKLVKRLYGLQNIISYLCFSSDGQYLAASLASGGIRVWETQRWEQVFSDIHYGGGSDHCVFDARNRLLTTSSDGYLRLYSSDANRNFTLVAQRQMWYEQIPWAAEFSPTGDKIAVGFKDSKAVYVLEGQTLTYLFSPDTNDVNYYDVFDRGIAWSPDGQRLCAGGTYDRVIYESGGGVTAQILIRCWFQGGQGSYIDWPVSNGTIRDIHFLQNGDLIYGTQEPNWGVLDSEGQIRLGKQSPMADYRGSFDKRPTLLTSQDGSTVQFDLKLGGSQPARFSLIESQLVLNPIADNTLLPPDRTSLNITDWYHALPKLNGTTLSFPLIGTLIPEPIATALAISPDKSTFLLGTNCCALRLFDTQGQQKWGVVVPGVPTAINISGDQAKAIAALNDGTIRWYNLEDGEELFAFFPHNDGKRWIAWTPSGYYMSFGEDADNLLGWHVNHGRDQEASFYPVEQKYSKTYKRPEVVKRTFVELSEAVALQKLEAENTPNAPPKTPILRVETGMHTARINRFDVDANEQFLVTASSDKTLRLWELATGKLITTYRVPMIETGNEGLLYSTAIYPNGQWIATAGVTGETWEGNYLIYLFNRTTGQLEKRLMDLPERIQHLCFSPDGQYLAASLEGKGGIRIWETQQWQPMFSDTRYDNDSVSCQFNSKNRLLTTSLDGYLRLYSSTAVNNFALAKKTQPPGGKRPFHAAFSPKSDKIAVGFDDSTQVNVLDGQTLDLLYSPDTSNVDSGNFVSVAWSPDGQRLCAAGRYLDGKGSHLIRCWSQGGQGNYTDWLVSSNTIIQLRFLKNGDLVYSTADPSWGILDSAGNKKQEHVAPIANYIPIKKGDSEQKVFWVSHDGDVVQFGFEIGASRPARFSLDQQLLLLYPAPDSSLQLADTTSLNITDWQHNSQPKLNGSVLPLESGEISHSLAIAPDKSWFVLGTEFTLHAFGIADKDFGSADEDFGSIPLSSPAWAVNFSGDGKKLIAALGDGTIHWYSNGRLLAFFPHTDGKRWIAWTPSGYYMSSGEDADNLIGWHVNQGKDQAAKFYPINALPTEYQEISVDNSKTDRKRPDIVKKVLDTLTEDKAILVANLERGIDAGKKISPEELAELLKKYDVNLTPSGLGKAIIVAASGPKSGDNANTLFGFTNKFTERMYNLLHKRGFSDGDVIYINPYPPAVPSGNYEDSQRRDFPLRDPLNELKEAFDQASRDLKSGQQFIFYLHGHAEYQKIRLRLSQGSETSVDLSAQELKELLAQIPKDVLQIIILDTCHSGSFLAELAGVPNRIVVTSADSDSLAWTSDKGKSFADTFIQKLSFGVGEAFEMARKTILDDPELFGNQSPQLDDNQDGQYIEGEDGELARNTYIGGNKVSASVPPVITEVHPAIYLDPQETTATLWVKTSVDMNTVNKVQAILTNETDKPTEYQGESTQFIRREITLTPNYELQRFETEYTGFQAAKQWRIFYQVETIEGQWSDFEEGFVRTDNDASTITLETIMNQTAYQAGDPFRFEVITTGEGNFDLYVGLIFPEGNYYTIRSPFQFSAQNELLPYLQNLRLAEPKTFTIVSLSANLLPTMLFGEYQACSLLTKAQSDPNDHNNWVKLHCQPFRF